jgi:hypothetical protein
LVSLSMSKALYLSFYLRASSARTRTVIYSTYSSMLTSLEGEVPHVPGSPGGEGGPPERLPWMRKRGQNAPHCGGWDPSAESGGSKSEQAQQCIDLEHFVHLEPTHLDY